VYIRKKNVLARNNEIWDQYRNLLFQQTEKSISFSKISPFSVFRWLSDRISDNDYYGYMNFQSQVSLYQEAYCNFIKDKDASDPKSFHLIWNCPYSKSEFFMSRNVVDPSEVPVFDYQSPQINTIIYQSIRDFLILLTWLIVLFVGVTYAFVKYDIR
jgi:hypothetical protein